MALTVKAILSSNGSEPEIRRFSVDNEVASSFVYLEKKVVLTFPALLRKKIDLYWKDDEGDMILMSTDDELMAALSNIKDGLLKIFIKVKENERSSVQKDEATDHSFLHPGVVCDGCEGGIRGVRYKCTACADYDLCSECEKKGLHPMHDMMRIEKPPFMGFGYFPPNGGSSAAQSTHPSHNCPPFVPPPVPGYAPPPHSFGAWAGFGGPFGPWSGPPHGGFPGWRRQMQRCWRKYAKQQEAKASGCNHTEDEGKEKNESANLYCDNECNDDNNGEGDADTPQEEYLQNVGETVAAMLDPFGIDVEIDVEHNGRRRGCHAGFRGRRGHCGPNRGNCRGRGGHCGMGGPWWGPWGMTTGVRHADNSKQETQATREPTAPPATEQPAKPDVEMKDSPATETSKRIASPPRDESEWAFVNSADPPAAATEDPAVAEARLRMLSMGFNDNDGWLTRLLADHNGDISRVLDIIQASASAAAIKHQ